LEFPVFSNRPSFPIKGGSMSISLKHAVAVVCACTSFVAGAQSFPSKTVRIIVPNSPGGAMDILGNLYATHLRPIWNQPVVIEYKPGANNVVGTDYTAKADPDGHTLCVVAGPHSINPAVRQLPYDTLKDLAGITLVGTAALMISATPGLPANTFPEVIALAKRPGSKMNYATAGAGSAMHLIGELVKQQTGAQMQHIAFKGAGPAYPEVMAGRVELIIDPMFSSMPHVRAGKMKAIAITSEKRLSTSPDIPALGEYLPGFNVESVNGMVLPGRTPRAIVNRINADFVRILALPEMRARLAELGIVPVGNRPEEYDAFIRSEITRWSKVINDAGIKID
jgi:tripartite-type tricarboxylate transporter receptor subunit TctC